MSKKIPQKPTHRKRSPFYWWRRFPTHKPLHPYKPLIERIQNGDFDYPEYFEQAKWEDHWCEEEIQSIRHLFNDQQNFQKEASDIRRKYAKRRNLLIKDGVETEKKRLEEITKQFSISLGGTKDEIREFMSTFDGTLEEMYYEYAKRRNIRNVRILESMPIKKRGRGRPPKNSVI
jgi:hypothetical protein